MLFCLLWWAGALVCLQPAPPPPAVTIEVREGGGRQAPPHPVLFCIRSDGQVKTARGEYRVQPERVQKLVAHLERLGAFGLRSGDLLEEVVKAGEAPASVRGGSGMYTLSLTRGDQSITVRLNQPDRYPDTKVKSVRVFQNALRAIREFVKEVERTAACSPA
jgi:hypothetical protein